MARIDEHASLERELQSRLELVNNDPDYEGEQATSGDQVLLAVVGLVVPLALLIGGWLIYV